MHILPLNARDLVVGEARLTFGATVNMHIKSMLKNNLNIDIYLAGEGLVYIYLDAIAFVLLYIILD